MSNLQVDKTYFSTENFLKKKEYKMNKRKIFVMLAMILILALSIGCLVACNPTPDESNSPSPSTPDNSNNPNENIEQGQVVYDNSKTAEENGIVLENAIKNAQSGDKITISAGTFAVPELQAQKDLVIEGAGADKTVLQTKNSATKFFFAKNINLNISKVCVIASENTASGVIIDNKEAADKVLNISSCKFSGFEKSISVSGGKANIAFNEIICSEKAERICSGIQIDFGAEADINDNKVIGNIADKINEQAVGIIVLRNGKINKVKNNNILKCGKAICLSLTYDSLEDQTFLAEEAESANKISNSSYEVYRMVRVTTFADVQNNIAIFNELIFMSDIEFGEKLIVKEDDRVTLDLNGKNITVPAAVNGSSIYLMDNYGELTITDNSTGGGGSISSRGILNTPNAKIFMRGGRVNSIDSNGGGAAIWNEGFLEMTGGTLAFTGEKNGNNAGAPLVNSEKGEVIITGGQLLSDYMCVFAQGQSRTVLKNITLSSNTSYFMTVKVMKPAIVDIENVTISTQNGGCLENAGGTVTLKNCNFTQTVEGNPMWNSVAIAVSNGGTTTVESGVYSGAVAAGYIYNSGGTLNINGGTFVGETTVLKADQSTKDVDSVINVNGGEFTGGYTVGASKAAINIFAGEFSEDPIAYVDENSTSVQQDDKFIVTKR